MKQSHGNGSGKYQIHQDDMGGWVRVFSDSKQPLPQEFPLILSQVLTEWFRQRPHLRMRCVTPINKDGTTVELHAWYDLGVFPAAQAQQSES